MISMGVPTGDIDIQDAAWGQALMPQVKQAPLGQGTGPLFPVGPTYTFVASNTTEAVARLKKLMAQLEVDINYFNTFKGQGMAVNKFGVMKFDLNEIVAMLEK